MSISAKRCVWQQRETFYVCMTFWVANAHKACVNAGNVKRLLFKVQNCNVASAETLSLIHVRLEFWTKSSCLLAGASCRTRSTWWLKRVYERHKGADSDSERNPTQRSAWLGFFFKTSRIQSHSVCHVCLLFFFLHSLLHVWDITLVLTDYDY